MTLLVVVQNRAVMWAIEDVVQCDIKFRVSNDGIYVNEGLWRYTTTNKYTLDTGCARRLFF